MKRILIAVALVMLVGAVAMQAQTKYSGTLRCNNKSDKNYKVEIPDQPNHAFTLVQAMCEHIKPGVIAGVEHKMELASGTAEITGDASRWQGFNVVTMANGDKLFVRAQCTESLTPDGAIQKGECKYTLTGGTGKFAGIKGDGISRGKAVGGGNVDWEYNGQYVLK